MEHSSKKKVLFIITKSNWGGAQKYVYDLATSLPKSSFDVIVACGGSGILVNELKKSGVHTLPIDSLKRDIGIISDIKSFYEILSILKSEKPDIVHLNSSKAGGIGALAARLTKIRRIIFTCHGWAFNEERSWAALWLIRLSSWFTVALSHTTITVSERDLIDGKRLPLLKNKIQLIHNGIKVPQFKERLDARRFIQERAGEKGVLIGENDFVVAAIGELHKNKGYRYMFEAITEIKKSDELPVKLVVISDGEEKEKLSATIQRLNLEKDVALIGFIENAPTYLKGFDGFVFTSIKEGLPYVLIEAGFAQLPVVATDVGGVKEIIEDMKSGILVQPRKPKDIAQGLQLIAKNPDRASFFGNNLKEAVTAKFSVDTMARETEAVYRS